MSHSDNHSDHNSDKNNSESDTLLSMTVQLAAAYVGRNSVPPSELPSLMREIYQQLQGLSQGSGAAAAPSEVLKPAVAPRNSVHHEYLVCLEDGKKFKSLKRHLRTAYRLTPEEYRAKWGLAEDYPMVAPAYAKLRSDMARKMGLGRK